MSTFMGLVYHVPQHQAMDHPHDVISCPHATENLLQRLVQNLLTDSIPGTGCMGMPGNGPA